MNAAAPRLPAVDLLKALAAPLIVLHHLAFYGPMADQAALLAPALFDWLARHARIAVQVFLVVGGFLAAHQLAPLGRWTGGDAGARLLDRYLRLVLPYAAMLVLALLAAALARAWMAGHPSVPGAPSAVQLLAHLLLLQDLLGIEALSAGVWYVAIDFQLFALLVGLLVGARALERRLGLDAPLAPWAVAGLAAASLWGFNRHPAWDMAAPYFFAAYGLGVLAAWAPRARRPAVLGALVAAVVVLALFVDWRSRIAVAAAVALALAVLAPRWQHGPGRVGNAVAALARISYAVFLVHFPVCLVVNAAFVRFAPPDPAVQAAGVLLAFAASLAAGAAFHRAVEMPAARWWAVRSRRRSALGAR